MKLIDQVCTMYQGGRLKELGVTVSPIFSHFKTASHAGIALTDMFVRHIHILTGSGYWEDEIELTPAYSVAELGMMLPDYIVVDCYRMHLHEIKQEQNNGPAIFSVTIGRFEDKDVPTFTRNNEAIVRGELLIHLLENKLITADEVNKRLIC